MATAPSNESVKTSSSSHGSDQSIINRKIERRGIPGSFSANLGKRSSPPREIDSGDVTAQKNGGNTSVKAIVAWLESSSRDEAKSPTSICSDSRSKSSLAPSTLSKAASVEASVKSQQGLPMAPDVEEYSLTLLKYREYYTESPLARCLDEKIEAATTVSVKPVEENDASPLTSSPESQVVHGWTTPQGNDLSSGKQGLGCSIGSSASRNNDVQNHHQDVTSSLHRDPEEVDAFWAAIRSYLRISNEELEQTEYSERFSESHTAALPKNTTNLPSCRQGNEVSDASKHDAPPCRKVQSKPKVAAAMNRGRKRFLSVEEKMSEIDAFLGTT